MRHGSDGLLYTASAAPAASPQTTGERRGPANGSPAARCLGQVRGGPVSVP